MHPARNRVIFLFVFKKGAYFQKNEPPEAARPPDGLLLFNNMRFLKNGNQNKIIGMKFSIVEMVPTSGDIIFKLCPVSQLPYNAKFKK